MTLKSRRFYDESYPPQRSTPRAFSEIYRSYGVELLLALALVLTLILGGFATHPGIHVAGAALLLNLAVWRRATRGTAIHIIVMLLLDIVALITIIVGTDPFELWLSTFYGLTAILLLILL